MNIRNTFGTLGFVISIKVNTQLECKLKIGSVDGEGAVGDEMCQRWFVKFDAQDFSDKVAPQVWQTICSSEPSSPVVN